MVLSVPVIALGATLGTATSILALCGVTCLCRHMHPKKGVLQRDQDPDPEKARPGVLGSAQQVSAGGASASPRPGRAESGQVGLPGGGGEVGGRERNGPSAFFLARQARRGVGTANVLPDG